MSLTDSNFAREFRLSDPSFAHPFADTGQYSHRLRIKHEAYYASMKNQLHHSADSRKRQKVLATAPDGFRELELPAACEEVLPGVPWGRFDVTFTPAFWATRAWLAEPTGAL